MTQQPAGYLCRGGVPDMEVAAYTTVVCLRLVVRSITVLVSWNTCTAWSPVTLRIRRGVSGLVWSGASGKQAVSGYHLRRDRASTLAHTTHT